MPQDPYRYFRIEARDILDQLATNVLALERGAASDDVVGKLLRLAHTLKGAARIVKHRELADAAHALEDVLEPMRAAPGTPPPVDAVLALVDRMTGHVTALPAPVTVDTRPLPVSSTVAPAPAPPAAAISLPALEHTEASAVDELVGGLVETHTQLARARAAADVRPLISALIERLPGVPAARLADEIEGVAQAFHGTLVRRLDHVDRELAQVRLDAERLRLLPASSLVNALERTARDIAHAAGTTVALVATGGDIRVDARVVAGVAGALVQLVRNAVAHGIEPAAERRAAGKPATGTIAFAVALRGRNVTFTVRDDGRGIDLDAVRRAIARRGGPGDDGLATTGTAEALLAALLRGGISTAATVTPVAGRGIGLDVVGAAARELGGIATATTERGRGTVFVVTAPVTLAALPALVVASGGRIAAIPLTAVRRVVRAATADIAIAGDRAALPFDDVAVPFAHLDQLLGAATVDRATAQAVAPAITVVIVDDGDRLAAIAVDHLVGNDELVLRAVPGGAPVAPLVWGIALDRDGAPLPVLDPVQLVLAAARWTPDVATSARSASVLVVDDSLTTRMLEQSILESAGYEVDLASSAEEALAMLRDRRYALVLADVEMPGMDGFGLVSALRARAATAALPAILVSSRDAPEDLRRGVEVGAQGYMIKSRFDQVELLALVRRLVGA